MSEKKNYCIYLKKLIDEGLCYDMQMISEGFINTSLLPDIDIDKEKLLKCCNMCTHKEI